MLIIAIIDLPLEFKLEFELMQKRKTWVILIRAIDSNHCVSENEIHVRSVL